MSNATGFTLLIFLSVLVIFIVLICSWVFCWVDTVGVILALAQLVMDIIVLNDMSRTFGKETGYTIGLVIFGFLFWTMLGFGASESVRLGDEETD